MSLSIIIRWVNSGRTKTVHLTGRATGMGTAQATLSVETPGLLLQTVILRGERTNEGILIETVSLPWFEIIALMQKDPDVAYQIAADKWEEIIAGAYKRAGFDDVILTPRSGDHGRDVIAVKKGICSVRVIDQVKAYKPPHLVTANDVRALMGVLQTDGASKGCLTTTADFAPRITTDPLILPFIPSRLELVNGKTLFSRLEN
jgi:restriction system protein